jgi:CheY-like chemotaxis protein
MHATKRILLVDGDSDNRAVYRAILKYQGYEVLEALDGPSAWELALSAQPAVLVTELALPKMSGFDLLQQLRNDDRTRAIEVIVLTAINFEAERRRAEAAGARLFLCKPVEPLELTRAIESVLGD